MKKKIVFPAEFTCINGHKTIGDAVYWDRHRCSECPPEARGFGPEAVAPLNIEKPPLVEAYAGIRNKRLAVAAALGETADVVKQAKKASLEMKYKGIPV